MRAIVAISFILMAFAGCLDGGDSEPDNQIQDRNGDGYVVVAVVDSGSNPYHFDFLGDFMPQHKDSDASNDIPLHQDPSLWLEGFPGADAFASYSRLDLTLTPDNGEAVPAELHAEDSDEWAKVQRSTADSVHYSYIPGTKAVGWVTFGGGDGWAASSHGVGTSSVSVGNFHGSCPECLLVMVDGLGEQANRWVEEQDWIDAQTNSWGYASLGVVRDRIYTGSDTEAQRAAVERGQGIFFSAGNGLANTFTATNPTLLSSQEGPDWIISVGAISPTGTSYTGHGKPADVASLGSAYPSAGGATVSAESTFGGTSNATPVTAGMYAKALHEVRMAIGSTRVQDNNTIASGAAGCGEANPDCPLADGIITYVELRDALLEASQHTPEGYSVGLVGGTELPVTSSVEELTLMAEGAGSFLGLMEGSDVYQAEVDRILSHLDGSRMPDSEPDVKAWQHALSVCRQSIWGSWDLGHATLLPGAGPDPAWPTRTFFEDGCPSLGPMLYTAADTVTTVSPFV